MTRETLLVLDVDGTLCRELRATRGFKRPLRVWHWQIQHGQAEPDPGALAAFDMLPDVPCAVVTNRPESLRDATQAWLRRHFPRLADAPLTMRRDTDARPAVAIRVEQVASVRGSSRVVLVDDVPAVRGALQEDDAFVLAPHQWSTLASALRASP